VVVVDGFVGGTRLAPVVLLETGAGFRQLQNCIWRIGTGTKVVFADVQVCA
jgi:hypothetical protein